jgi:membrane protein required for colicin V production
MLPAVLAVPAPLAVTTVDTIVFAAVGLMAVRGAWKGFAWQAVRTAGLVLALVGATAWHENVGRSLSDTFSFVPESMAPWVAWVLLLVLLFLAGAYLAWLARGAVRAVRLGRVDRVLGFVIGGALGLVLVTAGVLAWGSVSSDERLSQALDGSVTAPWMGEVVGVLRQALPDDLRARWHGVLETLSSRRTGVQSSSTLSKPSACSRRRGGAAGPASACAAGVPSRRSAGISNAPGPGSAGAAGEGASGTETYSKRAQRST